MATLSAFINGVGIIGPGIQGWPAAAGILTGATTWTMQPTAIPPAAALPAAERRRCGAIVKLSLAVGFEAAAHACADVAALPTVFSASGGDGANCHEICQALASSDRLISPTRFHNSVHNAAAGYWSIATGATAPSSVLCAYDGSFGAGLLEAFVQSSCDDTATLLIVGDTVYPEPLRATRPISDEFGVALVVAPTRAPNSLARVTVALTDAEPTPMSDPRLETLRATTPGARSLPLLALLAAGSGGKAVLDYLDETRLAVTVEPC